MGFNQKSWIENYVQSLCPLKITREKVDEEIKNIVNLMNELFNGQDISKKVEFVEGDNLIIFPGRKSNIFIVYSVDEKNNELKIVRHKKPDLNSEIDRATLINCKVEQYLVQDEPSITMDEITFDNLNEAINCAFSRILN
ncbi:hypothetical protein B0P06_004853 [Clostridium saccharoperbutylacetonicum]|uniref:Uncharacterized protein n=1 Tax=Clostridium saccharoperbutylacetonicum N1-4(HMT) TaxID=931276 RepID=M1MQ54_9CLOT|nr:hypothetical protein [Clostridium saccharoperbutylacetonicum]AGF56866.1 hypothetical protein Cspa_c31050 [Clostridium saccharoperbutylacetonicum N1-4(HMT)]NRT62376.1 hypothetical protein [Clostridium saccharoperbutylacetonicum]NSB25716.1 hypothetical protein [Clostridium saccharoperbutylacetonicum]NSB45082.1 hypothetical protein [Clostridium saccharoperbutylacetonicum]